MTVLDSREPVLSTGARRRKWPARVLAVLALAAPAALLVSGCGSGPVSTIDEGIAVTAQPITSDDVVSRAMEWVNARLTYCQVPNGAVDTIDPACSYICRRTSNHAWNPYRSDCSGLVSWAWKLPPPGLVTWNFAPFNQGANISHVIKASDLQPGDALNSDPHIILFKKWVHKGSTAELIEEPGCSANPDYAHQFTATLNIDAAHNTITIPGYGDTFHPIRYNGWTPDPTDKAKAVRKWSNAARFHGRAADYLVCAGHKVKMSFTFKNIGTAVWRDVKGRGDSVGSDVFLVTASGKKDRFTGHRHYSIRLNKNRHVRGDRNAPNCSNRNGCRKTTFIEGDMSGHAPKKPGFYKTRWRLRDYSKYWGNSSHGFGPKVQIKFKVVNCNLPTGACGCKVTCNNGQTHQLSSSITSKAQCASAGEQYCRQHNAQASFSITTFKACATPPSNPVPPSSGSGASSSSGGSASGSGTGTSSSSGGGASGSGGGTSSGSGGSASSGSGGAAPFSGNGGASGGQGLPGAGGGTPSFDPGSENNPNAISINQKGDNSKVQDDPGYSDYGFNGNDQAANMVPNSGCSIAAAGEGHGSPLGIGALMVLLGVVEIRRRARRRGEAEL